MADNFHSFPGKLEDICLKFIGRNGKLWSPEDLLGIPRHLLLHVAEYLHPFDLERLEETGVFKSLGILTDSIWNGFYVQRWYRKSKWPDVYFKSKGIPCDRELWKVLYLQRHLQEAINRVESRFQIRAGSPLLALRNSLNIGPEIQNVVSVCGRYAAYLRLYNPACIFLAIHLDIFLKFADSVEFLEVFLLRDNGVDSLCLLLEILASKRLKSVGFCFCKVSNIQMWNKIICSVSRSSESHNQTPFQQSSPLQGLETLSAVAEILTDSTSSVGLHKSANSDNATFGGEEDIDIYNFNDVSDSCTLLDGAHKSLDYPREAGKLAAVPGTSDISERNSPDLYDEIFSQSKSAQTFQDFPTIDKQESTCELSNTYHHRSSAASFNLDAPLSGLSTVGLCTLIHFELIAFRLHHDLFALLVNALKGWLTLESLIFQDNALGFMSDPRELVHTLSLLCTQGKLRSLEITNNPVDDDFARLLFEKLVSVQCCKCIKIRRSLRKLIFSSHRVSATVGEYFARGISSVCLCKQNNQDTLSTLQSVFNQCDHGSEADTVIYHENLSTSCEKKSRDATNISFQQLEAEENKSKGQNGEFVDTPQAMGPKIVNCQGEPCKDILSKHFLQSNRIAPVCDGINAAFVGIQELTLTCTIEDRGALAVADGLWRNSTIQTLSLPNCDIHTAGLAAIFKAISGNTAVKTLCVRGNHYVPGADDSLAEMLELNRTLTNLDIASCSMGGLSQKIVQALCVNNTLTSLLLAANRLGDAGVTALCQVFSHPHRLSRITKLDLSYNQASHRSVTALASSLQHIQPRKLAEINLTGNPLDVTVNHVMSSLKARVMNLITGELDRATLFADFISQM